ncbi:MAG: FkbM family methyltransferase [Methanogenium sp.]|jgi:FkbM family methyltransferase
MSIKKRLGDIRHNHIFCGDFPRGIINRALKRFNYQIIPVEFTSAIQYRGLLFSTDYIDFKIIDEVFKTYYYSDIRPTDIVLDIGAHVGGYTLRIANSVSKVIAVEPIYYGVLASNVVLNQLSDKVEILTYALSSKEELDIQFGHRKAHVCGKTLTELIELCGGHIDVLKIDCEGGEWCITLDELREAKIRRLEGELHAFNGEDRLKFIHWLEGIGYDVWTDHDDGVVMMFHAQLPNTTNNIIGSMALCAESLRHCW